MNLDQLKRAASIPQERAEEWLPILKAVFEEFDINTPLRQAAFIAQMGHESSGFTRTIQNFNYSVKELKDMFGGVLGDERCEILGRQPEESAVPLNRQQAIANLVYNGQRGNKAPDDGWKYRGRGLIKIKCLDDYQKCGKALRLDLIKYPELLVQDGHAARSAGWMWQKSGCNELADNDDIREITRLLSPFYVGLEDRLARYKKAKRHLK
ncbi:hypothetical protein CBW53_03030 [Yersinia frederiksenii]|nr:hypothetical protein CBW53_03030 [Yersinia frederiksenii]